MDFAWTPEQDQLREAVAAFASKELSGRDLSDPDEFTDAWRACASLGLLGLHVPEPFGSGADALTTIAALEGLGYGCTDNGFIFSVNAHMWAVAHPIARFGSEEQQRRYLPGLCDGTLVGAHGMSEPESGSDAFSLRTTAVETGDTFRLSGSKVFVTNGPLADVFVVFATTDRSRGFAGLCAFVVERGTEGLSLSAPVRKMGLSSSPIGELFLDECVVPSRQLLGRRGGGMAVFNTAMTTERSLILAAAVGTMQRELQSTIEYANDRVQFGEPIGAFQAISHRIVDMQLRLECSRLLLHRLGWKIDRGESISVDAPLTKLCLSESALANATDAMRVRGGYGYLSESGLEAQVRDAFAALFYSGTSDIQKNLAARAIGVRATPRKVPLP